MKHLIATLVGRLGYVIANKKRYRVVRVSQDAPSSQLNLLALGIRSLLADGIIPFVVQVGASNGTTNDPLHSTLKLFKLPGILVEPEPFSFAELRNVYADSQNVVLENCAISATGARLKLYCYCGKDDSLKLRRRQFTSSRLEHLLSHGLTKNEIEEIEVPCLTLAQLLEKHNISSLDVLQVDVEGNDDQVVFSALASGKIPRIIHFEHSHIPFDRMDKLLRCLHDNGYEFAQTEMDTLAYNVRAG